MTLLHDLASLAPARRPVFVAIGMFDGVHRGHQHILGEAVTGAREAGGLSLVITFDRHPAEVVAPGNVPPLLQPLKARLAAIETMKPDALWLIHFDAAFSRQTGEEFIRRVAREAAPLRQVCVGENFHFGHRRSGDAARLREWGAALGFAVTAMPPVRSGGLPISSTRVRELVSRGAFVEAAELLGRPYQLRGVVTLGDQLGRRLGFPTANLDAAGLVLPPRGVYATIAEAEGRAWAGVTNLGLRPTLREAAPTTRVETHLFDFDGDLYGREVGLRFVGKLRDEQRFASLEQLQAQIQRDVATAKQVLGREAP